MKVIKSISVILFSALFLFLTSCGGKVKKCEDGTHTHEDGTVHHNNHSHETDEDKPQKQESFKVEADSATNHNHDDHGDHGDHGDHDHGDHKH